MDTVATLEQFLALTDGFAASHGPLLTNCYLLPDELQKLLSGGGLRYASDANDLLLLGDQPGYNRLLFYTASMTPVSPTRLFALQTVRQPVLIDLVTRNLTTIEPLIKTKWLPSGFCLHNYYQRMRLAAGSALHSTMDETQPNWSNRVLTADANRIPEIIALWKRCLDPYSITLPDRAALQTHIEQKQVFCIVDQSGVLCAAALASRHGSKVTLQHVCVHPGFRRQGLARQLLVAAIQADRETGAANWLLWVAQDNKPAIQLYQSLGFAPDGTVSAQLMLMP